MHASVLSTVEIGEKAEAPIQWRCRRTTSDLNARALVEQSAIKDARSARATGFIRCASKPASRPPVEGQVETGTDSIRVGGSDVKTRNQNYRRTHQRDGLSEPPDSDLVDLGAVRSLAPPFRR